MRLQLLHLLLLCTFVVLAAAWTKEDHEIFRLRDEVEASEGPKVTFYDFLGVKPSATYEEIRKAFQKKSRALHPDKVKHSFVASRSTGKPRKPGEKKPPGVHVSKGPSQKEIQKFVKQATERYGRLAVVADVLKGQERERYDHFLKNGFPKWRGSGYYYTRFRPGLGSVVVGIFLLVGGAAHHWALVMGWKRQREFVGRYIRHARKDAWGDESGIRGIPGLSGTTSYAAPAPPPAANEESDSMANLNRRQKREMERQNKKESKKSGAKSANSGSAPPPPTVITGPTGEKRRVLAENGKVLIVDSVGNVFLEEEDEEGNVEEFLLDIDEIPRPTWRDTAVYRLPAWLLRKAIAPFTKDTTPIEDAPATPVTETVRETQKADTIMVSNVDESQDSAESFEMVDSTGIEKEIGGGGKKRSGKKGKK